MKTVVHKAETRGKADHGWLKSYHTFSFANYQNPERMNFGMLRVLNDDVVKPKMGFGTHPHKNMEIISIPLEGALSHKDSMENKRAIEVGEVQVMSAGTGLTHSEFNDSREEEVNFLQLWIIPEKENVTPAYNQKEFDKSGRKNKFQVLVSPIDNPIQDSLNINQQAYISLIDLDANFDINYQIKNSNGAYFFLIHGEVSVEENKLKNRDAVGIWETNLVKVKSTIKSKLLVVEVPMG